MYIIAVLLFCASLKLCSSQEVITNYDIMLNSRIGNFSMELLYHTMTMTGENSNLIISSFSIWTMLYILSKATTGPTKLELRNAIRSPPRSRNIKNELTLLWRQFDKENFSFEIQKIQTVFIDEQIILQSNFTDSMLEYGVGVTPINIADGASPTQQFNILSSQYPRLRSIDLNDLKPDSILPYVGLYFKGEWKFNFDTIFTSKQSFYDAKGEKLGEVNMMYNRHPYLITNIDELKATAIEIPYGRENILSMLMLLPYKGVNLKDSLKKFVGLTFDEVVEKLNEFKDTQEEVLAVIPRFRIKTRLDLTPALNNLGIYSLFSKKSIQPLIAYRQTINASKFVHNVEIEVTESGTMQSAVMQGILGTRVGVTSFVANRPFLYFIYEKTSKTIMFCGDYRVPELY